MLRQGMVASSMMEHCCNSIAIESWGDAGPAVQKILEQSIVTLP